MKKILITGSNSYIGTSFEAWVSQWPDEYQVDTIDMINIDLKSLSFCGYDTILHVAAIVHVKENTQKKYFEINRNLAVEVAKKAKKEGVKQFVFMSTMGIYGTKIEYIDANTKPNPKTLYAKSKYEAENLIFKMNEDAFKVVILRPPIVYGRYCRGNYSRLVSIALKLPFFPLIKNERSMIYIDNLSEFIRLIIEYSVDGLFFPQNKDYVNTTELVKLIAKMHGKKIKITKFFNFGIVIGSKLSETFRKVFGSFVYDKKMSGGSGINLAGKNFDYETVLFEESIHLTELLEQN